jgi:predicted nucleotidyltransferase
LKRVDELGEVDAVSDYRHSGCTDRKLEAVIRDMVAAYRDVFGGEIDQILLYGSYARGEDDGDSDIDMAAIVHGDRQELQEKLKKVWDVSSDLELTYEVVISPTVIPYDEFMAYQEDLPYYRNIADEGIIVD